ncbi:MAG: hypothetical protein R3C97_01410 [Geminicoccaceae bacterium]
MIAEDGQTAAIAAVVSGFCSETEDGGVAKKIRPSPAAAPGREMSSRNAKRLRHCRPRHHRNDLEIGGSEIRTCDASQPGVRLPLRRFVNAMADARLFGSASMLPCKGAYFLIISTYRRNRDD